MGGFQRKNCSDVEENEVRLRQVSLATRRSGCWGDFALGRVASRVLGSVTSFESVVNEVIADNQSIHWKVYTIVNYDRAQCFIKLGVVGI
jgi:hypothetical protein